MRNCDRLVQSSIVRLAVVSGSLLLLGCSNGVGESVRRHTYPPDFNYLSQDQIESTMGQLAHLVTRLNAVMAAETEIDASTQAEIVTLLGELEEKARALGPGGWPSNHPRISAHVDSLRDDLRRARIAAEKSPPNYFWAGSISGACTYCHAPRV
jgi:outer membrane murein-binding lipoprotein Lpp